jgi:hypothetical protein
MTQKIEVDFTEFRERARVWLAGNMPPANAGVKFRT